MKFVASLVTATAFALAVSTGVAHLQASTGPLAGFCPAAGGANCTEAASLYLAFAHPSDDDIVSNVNSIVDASRNGTMTRASCRDAQKGLLVLAGGVRDPGIKALIENQAHTLCGGNFASTISSPVDGMASIAPAGGGKSDASSSSGSSGSSGQSSSGASGSSSGASSSGSNPGTSSSSGASSSGASGSSSGSSGSSGDQSSSSSGASGSSSGASGSSSSGASGSSSGASSGSNPSTSSSSSSGASGSSSGSSGSSGDQGGSSSGASGSSSGATP